MPDETIRPKKTKRAFSLAAALVLVALAAAAFVLGRPHLGDAGAAGKVALFAAREGPLRITVTESGTIKPKDQVIITSQVEGRTTILFLVPEGVRVKKGQLLVELDASKLEDVKVDQEIRVQNAEAAAIRSRENLEVVRSQGESDVDKMELALRFARDDLRKYREGEYPNRVKELEARITLAEEDVHRTEEKLKWSKVLFEEKYLAETELQADELAAKKARLDLELAQNNLALFKEYTCKRTLAQLESDVKQGVMALERVKRKAAADLVQAKADLTAKESEYRRQQSKLQKITEQIAKARIVAPTDGLVVYATSAKASWRGNKEPLDEGQEVRERQELIYLPTASTFVAEVKVHESSLDKIRTGLPVRVTLDAVPGREFSGTVTRIAPLPDAQSMFMNPDLKIYRTQITINGGGDVLRTGMTCQAEIIVAEYPRALYVPVQSVVRVNGRPTVYVWRDGLAVPRTVKIGLDNNRMVRVLDGLTAGEEVLLSPPLQRSAALEQAGTAPGGAAVPVAKHLGSVAPKRRTARGAPGKSASPGPGSVRPRKSTRGPVPGAAKRRPGFGKGGRGGRRDLTPEQARQLRERFRKMTPEQREAVRKRWMQARGRRQDAASNGE